MICQMTFHTNLVNAGCVYIGDLLEQQGMDAISPGANSVQITAVTLRKNSKGDDHAQE